MGQWSLHRAWAHSGPTYPPLAIGLSCLCSKTCLASPSPFLPCDLCHPTSSAATSSYSTVALLFCKKLAQEGSQLGPHTLRHLRTEHGNSCPHSGPAAPKLSLRSAQQGQASHSPQIQVSSASPHRGCNPFRGLQCVWFGAQEPKGGRWTFLPQKIDKCVNCRM